MSEVLDVSKTQLEGVLLIKPLTNFEDFRGGFVETWHQEAYEKAGIDVKWVQDDLSWSHQHVLRGFHGDWKTHKMVCCPYGRLWVVILDAREDSPTYGKSQGFAVTMSNRYQLFVPPGCAMGHVIMSELGMLSYKQSQYYDRDSQFTIKWDDPRFNVYWPVQNPILSLRDKEGI
ncbi:dTDP-4-dehydrorhamnose 3,5-epimerase family protein [Magnetofaba australis]|uniref:dTDP-4-dehydrorhamnose 3,5-epimerase n=1 Tax=Magnetofaba australis IT-1 TaxID=1434232 RepID=A0A1Y2K8T4_9PROT|nr:dTDP-4-dehydrorhamnose 3,5-epimerase family protein [Magnetofaba australis]OSM05205.1 putative dTDP-4-dehydrorhamnose 3,5-epimerase [Magnetofaba australis IT-1]